MRRGRILVVVGVVLAIGGPTAGWIVSRAQEGDAQAAVDSGAPPEVLAEYMTVALYSTAIGYAACILGIGVLITGLVMRARAKRAQPNGPDLAA